MKRTISFLLVLVMLLGILPMAAFAEDTEITLPQVTLTADKTTVQAGEDITLTLSLDGDLSKSVTVWQWNIVWDSTYFTAREGKVGNAPQPKSDDEDDAIEPMINLSALTNYPSPYKSASVTSGDGVAPHKLKRGTIATVTLTAKEDITGNATAKFFMDYVTLADKYGDELAIVTNDPTVEWGEKSMTLPGEDVGLSVAVTPKVVAPDPINITVYYAKDGAIVTGQDGTLLNFAPVTVEDLDGDGVFTMAEGFTAMHKAYCEAGADGYEGEGWINKFWGITSSDSGYVHNHRFVSSSQEEIKNGDSISFFWYQDADQINFFNSFSDLYTYFDSLTGTATANEEKTFHVNGYSVFGSGQDMEDPSITYNAVAAPENATVTATCGEQTLTTTVDANGDFKLTFPAAGTWTVLVNGTCDFTATEGFYANKAYTDAPVVPALMTVTVAEEEETDPAPDPEPDPTPDPEPTTNGYTVTLDEKKEVTVGETISIEVKVGHTDEKVETYNAFDMTFSYDATALKLTSTTIEGLTVTTDDGTVRVQGFGEDKTIGSAAFTLTFEAQTTGDSEVKATTAKVDAAAHAIDKDAPEVAKTTGSSVTVGGYPVTLPDNFTGNPTAEPGKDYTFSEPEDSYDYTVTVKVNGQEVTPTKGENGSYTIKGEDVTGKIEVTIATKTGKTFDVTLGTDMTGEKTAQYMTDYTATLTRRDGFEYDVSVTIGGKSYSCDVSGNSYTIRGEDITGDIVFTVTRKAQEGKTFSATFEGSGKEDAEGNAGVTPGASYSFKLNKAEGYDYKVTATMGGAEASFTESEDTYTFDQVTGNLIITITKTLHLEVAVYKFVELDDKTVALVTATATLGQGQALSYDGTAMFWSDGYNAWCYLVIVEDETLPTAQEAAAKIVATETTYTTLSAAKDVNESGTVDINDAQLVYDIYNSKYLDFNTVTMQKFLNADVNADYIVNVADAAAVVAAIQ